MGTGADSVLRSLSPERIRWYSPPEVIPPSTIGSAPDTYREASVALSVLEPDAPEPFGRAVVEAAGLIADGTDSH